MLHVLHVAACMSLHVAAVVAKRRAALLHATADNTESKATFV